jgi:HD-GYP domain-containing protein (c-di-GMP phosphodiesterase class II)
MKVGAKEALLLEKAYKVSRRLRAARSLRELLTYVLDSCIKIAEVENGSLQLLDEDGKLFIAVAKGLPEHVIEEEKVKVGERISGWVAEHKEVLVLQEGDERFAPFMLKKHIKSAILLPLQIRGKVVGVLNLSSSHPIKGVDEEKKKALLVCSTLAAAAILNHSLQEKVRTRLKKLQHLVEITKNLSLSTQQEEIVSLALEALAQEVRFDAASLLLHDEDSSTLVIYSRLLPEQRLLEHLKQKTIQLLKRYKDVDKRLQLDLRVKVEGRRRWRAKSLFTKCFPLLSRGDVVGLLCIHKRDGVSIDAETCRYLSDLASKIAIAWENNRAIMRLQRLHVCIIRALAAELEEKSPYTREHSDRVAKYAVAIAKRMGMEEKFLQVLEEAALLHDVGKIGVETSILNKPGRLTEEEFQSIKKHPIKSENIIKTVEFLHSILPAVRYHHERWDGAGYPEGLRGEQIPLEARIIAVADTFDALLSRRPYRDARSLAEAKEEIVKNAQKQFDPSVVEAFLDVADRVYEEVRSEKGEAFCHMEYE